MQKYNFLGGPADFGAEARETRTWKEATIRDLKLPAVVSVQETSSCSEATSKMQKGGFDQLPVVNHKGTLRGLITLGTPSSSSPLISFRKHFILRIIRKSNY